MSIQALATLVNRSETELERVACDELEVIARGVAAERGEVDDYYIWSLITDGDARKYTSASWSRLTSGYDHLGDAALTEAFHAHVKTAVRRASGPRRALVAPVTGYEEAM